MQISRHCLQKLAIAIFTIAGFYPNLVNAEIVPDATLPNNSIVRPQGNINIIENGTQAGSNLFHSFERFSIPTNTTAYFNNSGNIENIITRITGKSISNIDGIIRANGTANLFLINPNGIIFGNNAALDIGGSFLATTAGSISFADGTKFSAIQPQTSPLLTISVPIGLQFAAIASPIRNQSQASVDGGTNLSGQPAGLQIPRDKTLALIGGDITLEGGNLTVESGRIELAAVAGNSFVSLNSTSKGLVFGYEGVGNFQNVQLIESSNNGSKVSSSEVDVSGKGGGLIQVKGNLVELIGYPVALFNINEGVVDGGDINISARKLVVRDGAQILNSTFSDGAVGNLTVDASESVELIGGFTSNKDYFPSSLTSSTVATGKAGNLNINTSRLLVKDGAVISASSFGFSNQNSPFVTATGEGGNLTVNASNSVEIIGYSILPSSLSAITQGSANAGKLNITTKQLIVKDKAEISVSNNFVRIINLGNAGELNIVANSILIDNQGKITSETDSANGGNINLQLRDLLLMRRNSQISTTAGIAQLGGNGGNIRINIPDGFIVAIPKENSDITANAFAGIGGRVEINATGILGIKPRSRDELAQLLSTNNPGELNPQNIPTSDITAISQVNPNLNGKLNINALDVEPDRGITQLLDIPLDTQIAQVCKPSKNGNQSEFIYSRGAVPPLPGEALRSDSPLDVGWVSFGGDGAREGIPIQQNQIIQNLKSQIQTPMVEATGWIVDKNGDIVLTALKANANGQLVGVGGSDRTSKAPTLPCDATIKNKPG
jgi:filamentous hemagglutinin family protein